LRRVLIVDDEPLVRVALRSTVDWRRWGFECASEAANGEEALAVLREHPETALVILDLVMPRMDGLELLRILRERGQAPQVIVLTAHDEFPMVREAFKLGAVDYLLKSELETEKLAPLIAAAAARIERFGGPPGAAGHAVALKQEALHRLLESDRPELLREELSAHGVRLGPILRLGLLVVRDFEVVAARYDDSSRGSFSVGLIAAVEQVLERHGLSEVVRIDDGEYVLIVSSSERHAAARMDREGEELAGEIVRALADYLNIAAEVSWSAVAEPGTGCGPASLYRALAAGRARPSRLIERALEHIGKNFADPRLTMRSMSAELGVTPNHLSAFFARESGRSFREYLAFVRVEAAKRLLAGSGLRVWEVAERIGFINVEHFSRVFKKLTGVPPHLFTRAGPPP
jgi:two-component system response regulator YesN